MLATTLKAGETAEYAPGKARHLYLVPAAGSVEVNGGAGCRPRRRRDPRRGPAQDHRAGRFRTGAGRRSVSAGHSTKNVMPGLDPGIHPQPKRLETIMTKVLVLYYSAYGHIEAMANAVAEGAREAGAVADVKRVPELVPPDIAKASYYKLDQAAPIAQIADLANYDAIVVGTGTRFGRMASQMSNFLDQAGGLWAKGALHGKVGGAFTSDRDPARRPGNHAVLDHHQSAAFRHDHRRPELRFRGPDGNSMTSLVARPMARPRSPAATAAASRARTSSPARAIKDA